MSRGQEEEAQELTYGDDGLLVRASGGFQQGTRYAVDPDPPVYAVGPVACAHDLGGGAPTRPTQALDFPGEGQTLRVGERVA